MTATTKSLTISGTSVISASLWTFVTIGVIALLIFGISKLMKRRRLKREYEAIKKGASKEPIAPPAKDGETHPKTGGEKPKDKANLKDPHDEKKKEDHHHKQGPSFAARVIAFIALILTLLGAYFLYVYYNEPLKVAGHQRAQQLRELSTGKIETRPKPVYYPPLIVERNEWSSPVIVETRQFRSHIPPSALVDMLVQWTDGTTKVYENMTEHGRNDHIPFPKGTRVYWKNKTESRIQVWFDQYLY